MLYVNYSSFKNVVLLYILDTSPLLLIHVADFVYPIKSFFMLSFDDYTFFVKIYFLLILSDFHTGIQYVLIMFILHSSKSS